VEKLLIVDGSNLLFQMFYGMPNKIYNSKGETIHGTIGFIGALFKIIRLVNPNYIIVIFDGESQLERIEIDENYKANRTVDWNSLPNDEVPFFEMSKIKYVLDNINIYNIETDNVEADDLISSITYQFQDNCDIIISSFDSDFFQLINDNVAILRYRGKNTFILDKNGFKQKFGFTPDKYVFYKSLLGDKSDNIKGISKIGHKRATYLVSNYGNYEEIIANIDEIIPKCIREPLITEYNRFKINIKLISLNKNNKSDLNLYDLDYNEECLNESSINLLRKLRLFD